MFNKVLFGRSNASEIIKEALQIFLEAYKWQNFLVYLYYIIKFSRVADLNLVHVEQISSELHESKETNILQKCTFATQNIRYFDNDIETGRLSIYYTLVSRPK